MCRLLKISRSSYYAAALAEAAAGEQVSEVEAAVVRIFKRHKRHKRRYGTRRICAQLRDEGLKVGRNGWRRSCVETS